MTITVYYGEKENIFSKEPQSVFKSFVVDQKEKDPSYVYNYLHRCPSFKNYYSNTFSVTSEFKWSLTWDGTNIYSHNLSKSIFDKHFLLRNQNIGFASALIPQLYIVPDKPVEMELLSPTLSKSDINLKTNVVQGTFNPYYHIRPVEAAFYFLNKGDTISYYPGDDLFYLRFITNEKIKFKRFYCTREFNDVVGKNLVHRNLDWKILKMNWWYETSKKMGIRKKVMKEVLNNTCD